MYMFVLKFGLSDKYDIHIQYIDFCFIPGISIDPHSNKAIITSNHKFSKQSCYSIIIIILISTKHANQTNRTELIENYK